MQDVLQDNILRFWLDKMQDQEHGGFYGRIDGNGVLHSEAEKGAILNARILWSFSAAYRVLGNQEYLNAATRAKDYIIEHLLIRSMAACIGASITRVILWILRSSSMPSALPSMD